MKGFWNGSSKNNGGSGCGVASTGAGRDKWFMISKVAMPKFVGTAMVAEAMGVCVCSYGNLRCRVPQKSECSKYESVHRHPPQKSMMWHNFSELDVFKDDKMKCEIEQMLRKRACPNFDFECVRHSNKCDL